MKFPIPDLRFTIAAAVRVLLVALAFSLQPSAFASTVITGTVTITNAANLTGTNAETITINADTRTWTNAVSAPATQILTNGTVNGLVNRLLIHAATYPFADLRLISSTTTSVVWRAAADDPLAITLSPSTWGYVTLVTNTLTTAQVLRVPMSVEPAAERTNIASQLTADLRLYSTNDALGDAITVNGSAATDAELTNSSTLVWSLNTTPTPDQVTGYPTNLANAQISASAAIARSKIAAGTAAHVVINDGSGNLSSEATLGAARFPALTGDVTTAGGSLATTIAANAVALGTDTTGNYVADVSGTANEITSTHTPAEGSTATLSLPATIDLGGKTSFEIPNGAAPTVDAFGEIAGDNDLWAASRGAPVFFDGTAAVALLGALVSDAPSNGQVPKWNTGGTITWEADNTVGGISGTDTRVMFFDGTDTPAGDGGFTYNKTTDSATLAGTLTAATVVASYTGNGAGITNLPSSGVAFGTNAFSGATNTLTLPNGYALYETTTDCNVTNVGGVNASEAKWCVLTISNAAASAITLRTTAAQLRALGSGTTNALAIGAGKVGILSVFAYGATITNYATAAQQ